MWKCDIFSMEMVASFGCDKYQFRSKSFIHSLIHTESQSFAHSTHTHTLSPTPLILTIELLLSIDVALSTVRGCQFYSIRSSCGRLWKQCDRRRPNAHAIHQSDHWQWQKFMSCFCLNKDDGIAFAFRSSVCLCFHRHELNTMRMAISFSRSILKPFNSHESKKKKDGKRDRHSTRPGTTWRWWWWWWERRMSLIIVIIQPTLKWD